MTLNNMELNQLEKQEVRVVCARSTLTGTLSRNLGHTWSVKRDVDYIHFEEDEVSFIDTMHARPHAGIIVLRR